MTRRCKYRVAILAGIGVAVLVCCAVWLRDVYRFLPSKPAHEGVSLRVAPVAELFLGEVVFGLTEDENDQFWAGTSQGVHKINLKNGTTTKTPIDFGQKNATVYSVLRRGPHLLTSSWSENVLQFDLASGRILRKYKFGHQIGFHSASLSVGGKSLVACTGNRPARAVVLDADTLAQTDMIEGNETASFCAIATHPSEELVTLGDTDGFVRVYHLGTRNTVSAVRIEPESFVEGLAYSPDGTQLGVGTSRGHLGILDGRNQFNLLSDRHEGGVECVCFSPNGDYLLASVGYEVCCWHIATRRRLNLTVPDCGDNASGVRAIVFSSDGSRIVVAHNLGITVYNASDILK